MARAIMNRAMSVQTITWAASIRTANAKYISTKIQASGPPKLKPARPGRRYTQTRQGKYCCTSPLAPAPRAGRGPSDRRAMGMPDDPAQGSGSGGLGVPLHPPAPRGPPEGDAAPVEGGETNAGVV